MGQDILDADQRFFSMIRAENNVRTIDWDHECSKTDCEAMNNSTNYKALRQSISNFIDMLGLLYAIQLLKDCHRVWPMRY